MWQRAELEETPAPPHPTPPPSEPGSGTQRVLQPTQRQRPPGGRAADAVLGKPGPRCRGQGKARLRGGRGNRQETIFAPALGQPRPTLGE